MMYKATKIQALLYKLLLIVPDKWFLSMKYYKNFGHFPNWKEPKSFCEKIQWLKLYNRNPLFTTMVDKYEVKEYVSGIIGEEYIIPTIGVWNNASEIDFNLLPDKFVLKATHDSGRIVICKDKISLNKDWAIEEMNKSLERDFYSVTREWPYKNVKRKIIAENFMQDNDSISSDLNDYKFYCFNGTPKYCQVIRDRSTHETIDFYDTDWQLMPFVGLNPDASNGLTGVEKPKDLSTMLDICRKLSLNIPFVRIDLYVINQKIYFGEITFFPSSGVGRFVPADWDMKFGNMITLPPLKKIK